MPQQHQQQQPLIVRPPDQITYEMRLNYFKEPPLSPRKRLYVFAGLLMLGIIIFHSVLWTIVFALCLIPIVLRFVKWYKELHRPTMTDREYEQWIWSHAGIAEKEGRDKFRIAQAASEAQTKPQTIKGFVYRSDPDAKLYNFRRDKRGEDGRFRSSVSRFIVIYLAEHELCIYIRDINALGEDCVKKDSSHYYEMVTGISMDTYGHFGADGSDTSGIISADYFAVTMTSGHKIGMAVLSHDDLTEKTVAQLRQLLGAKRYGRGQGAANYPGGVGGYPGNPGLYSGSANGYPGVPNGYPGNTGPFPGANSYPGVPNGYPGNTGPFPGANGYPGVPNGYPGNTGPYPGANGNGYPGNTGPYPGANSYPGVPNGYPGNTGPYPGANSYPGVPNGYPGTTDPNSGVPNPYSANTELNSGVPNPNLESSGG